MKADQLPCPTCDSPYGYPTGETLFMCPECGYEWDPSEVSADEIAVKDANGTLLKTGDDVIVIKNLPVKGAPKPIKSGTKVKNIRIVDEGDHNIDCKIDGFGKMALKAQFVRKA